MTTAMKRAVLTRGLRTRHRAASGAAAMAIGLVTVFASGCTHTGGPSAPSANTSVTASSPHSALPTGTPAAAPQTVSLAGSEWSYFGGTLYTGCSGSIENGGPDKTHPRLFDTATGQFITPAAPSAAPGETVTGEGCAITGTAPDFRIIYTLHTTRPASGLNPEVNTKTAYVYDLHSSKPLVTKDISNFATLYDMKPTSTGAVIIGASRNGLGTDVLSNRDLSVLWSDPENATAVDDSVISLPRHKEHNQAMFDGLELRAPNGDSIYREPEGDGSTLLSEGPTHLVQLVIWKSKSPPILVTSYFDVNTRSLLTINGSQQLPGGGINPTLSNGRLFIDGVTNNGGPGLMVWNLQTQQMEFQKTPDEAKVLRISKINYFQEHLYIATGFEPATYSVYKLPDSATPIGTTWTSRPHQRLDGWTQVCKNEISNAPSHECDEVLVKDDNGGYPGPWS
jgi:hypothetical protein